MNGKFLKHIIFRQKRILGKGYSMKSKKDDKRLLSYELSSENDIKKLTTASLFTALITVSTLAIKIPIPVAGGYIHPGDGFVLLSAFFLNPFFCFFAAGIGSAFADLLGGYAFYAPATLIIKGLTATIASVIFKRFSSLTSAHRQTGLIAAGIFAELWMAAGYFLFESIFLSPAVAAAGIPFNCIQGFFGVVIAFLLYSICLMTTTGSNMS